MNPVDRESFTKARYIDAFSIAERTLGSVLPYGNWKDEYGGRFERMRAAIVKAYGTAEGFLALPDETLLCPELADAFNNLIVPLIKGEVKDRSHIMQYHGSTERPVQKPKTHGAGTKSRRHVEPHYPGW